MSGDDFIKAELALLAWREERSNGVNGQIAVMLCVRNRIKANWSEGDWMKVIAGHNQFSSMSVAGNSQTVLFPDTRDPLFLPVLQAVDGIYAGTTEDTLINGGLYYYNPGPGVTPGGWFEKTIIANPEKFPRCAVVGSTIFFKEID